MQNGVELYLSLLDVTPALSDYDFFLRTQTKENLIWGKCDIESREHLIDDLMSVMNVLFVLFDSVLIKRRNNHKQER